MLRADGQGDPSLAQVRRVGLDLLEVVPARDVLGHVDAPRVELLHQGRGIGLEGVDGARAIEEDRVAGDTAQSEDGLAGRLEVDEPLRHVGRLARFQERATELVLAGDRIARTLERHACGAFEHGGQISGPGLEERLLQGLHQMPLLQHDGGALNAMARHQAVGDLIDAQPDGHAALLHEGVDGVHHGGHAPLIALADPAEHLGGAWGRVDDARRRDATEVDPTRVPGVIRLDARRAEVLIVGDDLQAIAGEDPRGEAAVGELAVDAVIVIVAGDEHRLSLLHGQADDLLDRVEGREVRRHVDVGVVGQGRAEVRGVVDGEGIEAAP